MKDLRKIHTEEPEDSNLRMALSNGIGGETRRSLACYTRCWGKWHDQNGNEIHPFGWLYIFDPNEKEGNTPEIPGFEGTMDSLSDLTIKGKD